MSCFTNSCCYAFLDLVKELADKCVPGAKVLELCMYGDLKLNEGTSKIYRKDKEIKKGLHEF